MIKRNIEKEPKEAEKNRILEKKSLVLGKKTIFKKK